MAAQALAPKRPQLPAGEEGGTVVFVNVRRTALDRGYVGCAATASALASQPTLWLLQSVQLWPPG